jgi:hypothetical protein
MGLSLKQRIQIKSLVSVTLELGKFRTDGRNILQAFVAWHEVDKQLIKSLMRIDLLKYSAGHYISIEELRLVMRTVGHLSFFPENKCEFTLETILMVNVYHNFKRDNREAEMTQWGLPYSLK